MDGKKNNINIYTNLVNKIKDSIVLLYNFNNDLPDQIKDLFNKTLNINSFDIYGNI